MIHLTMLSFATNIYLQWQINANMSIEHWVNFNDRKTVMTGKVVMTGKILMTGKIVMTGKTS